MTQPAPSCAACGEQYEPDLGNEAGLCWLCRVATTKEANLDRLKSATLPRHKPERKRRIRP